MNNIHADPSSAAVATALKAELERLQRRCGDSTT